MMMKVKTDGGIIRVEDTRNLDYPGVKVFINNELFLMIDWDKEENIFKLHDYKTRKESPCSINIDLYEESNS